ncbi:MAG: hypothetical protein Q4G68_07005 [Planctomycetia bacterium]|nr:hypothetical protein [Planctomycetia bacterium]
MRGNITSHLFKNVLYDFTLSTGVIFAMIILGMIIFSVFPVPFQKLFMTQETKYLRQEMSQIGGSLNGINAGRIVVHSEDVNELSLEFFKNEKDFLGRCWYVDLSDTKVSDDVMILLEEIPNLQYLNLSNTNISDSAIDKMRGHRELRILLLNNTNITDQCVNSLISFPKLERLEINNTKLSLNKSRSIHDALQAAPCWEVE